MCGDKLSFFEYCVISSVHIKVSTMNLQLLFTLCLVCMTAAAGPPVAQILRYDNDYGIGSYAFGFEQSDGTKHEQQGQLKNQGRDDEALVVRGRYSYVGSDGVTYTVTYTADENGFRPEIAQGPGGAIPEAVVRSFG